MIYIGTDAGIHRWVDKSFWPAYHSLQDRAVVSLVVPGAGLLAALDGDGRVWESENNGLRWYEVPVPSSAGRPIALAQGSAPGSIVLTTRPLGLYERLVGGPVPEPTDGPPGAAFVRSLLRRARSFQNGGGSTGVMTAPAPSTAHAHAAPAAPISDGWRTLKAPAVSQQAVAPGIRALAVGQGEGAPWFAAVSGSGLWRSDDAAGSWTQCAGLPDEVYAIRIARGTGGIVAVATANGCWVSADRGRTWEERSGGLDKARHLRALEIHPEDPASMLAGAAPGETAEAPRKGTRFSLYETSDGGKTWSHVRRGIPEFFEYDTITDICYDPAATANAIVALDSGELWRTRNGGDWWEPIARQNRAARVLCPVL